MGPAAYFNLGLLSCLIFNPWLEASPHSVLSRQVRSGIRATICHTGWLQYKDCCFGLFSKKMTWSEAEVECQNYHKGAHLASIHTETEGDMVANYIIMKGYKDHVWIGLHNPDHDGTWMWADGSRYRFSAWNIGEPNNLENKEFCAELLSYRDLRNWNDINCKSKQAYVCKYVL